MCPSTLALVFAALSVGQPKPLPIRPRPIPVPPPVVTPAPKPVVSGDDPFFRAAHLPPTPQGALAFFRKRTQLAPDAERAAGLVKQLADADGAVRDRAAGELVCLGHRAVAPLRRAANNLDDSDTAGRARQCLRYIQGGESAALARAAARQLAAGKPEGAAEALLGYLPFAEDESVVRDIEAALVAVGVRDGKPDPALVRALADKVPTRRGAAAYTLCRLSGIDPRATVRPLLKDARPSVRLRAALGLAGVHDAEALPALIGMIADLPPAQRWQAESFLRGVAGEYAVFTPGGNDALSRRLAREAWASWWKLIDGPRLRDEIRARTPSDSEHEQIEALIARLGDKSEEAREKAAAELVDLGTKAVPLLRGALEQPALRPHVEKCLEAIGHDALAPLPVAAVRLLALRRPEGTVSTLLAYLPYADRDALKAQIAEVLPVIGCPGGKPDEALVAALKDKVGERRAAAALALCRGGATAQLPAVRRLLEDRDPVVRLRVALILAERKEKAVVPVVIALLDALPLGQVWEAEDFLLSLAGDKGPDLTVTAEAGSRTKCRQAWEAWWRKHGPALDLARLDANAYSNLVAVEYYQPRTRQTRVLGVGRDGKILWHVSVPGYAYFAEGLPNGNVLVIEQGRFIRERDRKGTVVWEHTGINVNTCQRLPGGNTLVVGYNQIQEVTPDHKVVFTHTQPGMSFLAARKLRDGQYAYFTYQGQYVRLDKAGKEVKRFSVPVLGNYFAGADVLPGDRVVVSHGNPSKVIEYNAGGKAVWETSVIAPGPPRHLANGYTVLTTYSGTRIVRLNRVGKVVAEMTNLPFRAVRVTGR